jgi:beta-lactamase superfamily II metal-dependent hydrolase
MSPIDLLPDDPATPILEAVAPLQLKDDDLAVFVLNVGDGDSIVIRFPQPGGQLPLLALVDCNAAGKTEKLITDLEQIVPGGVTPAKTRLRFACATHPHLDHIAGLEKVLDGHDAEEFWDSGFRYTSKTYSDLVKKVTTKDMQFLRPTAGFETFVRGVHLTVLSPSMALRNRYDTYGVDPNNASIVIRMEYPSPSPEADFPAVAPPPPAAGGKRDFRSIILGGDAQTDAWSHVLEDFPHLEKDKANWARQIQVRQGHQPLLCDVLKVSHHASKHGVNLELVERMGDTSGTGFTNGPTALVSSCDSTSKYGFPHLVAQEIMREVREPIASKSTAPGHKPDHELGIHYTCQELKDMVGNVSPAGSVAIVFDGNANTPDIYRMGDGVKSNVDLSKARKVH